MKRRSVELIKLKNPWAVDSEENDGGYHGPWAIWSEEWHLVTKRDLRRQNFNPERNGMFFMSFEDFIKNFTSLIICRQIERFGGDCSWQFYSNWSETLKTAGGSIKNLETFPQNPQFILDVTQQSQIMISMIQNDHIPETMKAYSKWPFFSAEYASRLQSARYQSSSDVFSANRSNSSHTWELLQSSEPSSSSLSLPSSSQTSLATGTYISSNNGNKNPPNSHISNRKPLLSIGFTIIKVEENRKYRVHKMNYEVAAVVPYIDSREIFSRFILDIGRYVLLPTTLNRGEEGEFLLRVFAGSNNLKSCPVNVFPLLKDMPSPSKPLLAIERALNKAKIPGSSDKKIDFGWVHPIGVFRVEIVKCQGLKKCKFFGYADPYCVLKFIDLEKDKKGSGKFITPSAPTPPPLPPPPPPPTSSQIFSLERLQSWLMGASAEVGPVSPVPSKMQSKKYPSSAGIHLKYRRHNHSLIKTDCVRATLNPVFKKSFMWAVRKPRDASLLIEVWCQRSGISSIRGVGIVGDILMGFVVLSCHDFMEKGRSDKIWEVSIDLLKPERVENGRNAENKIAQNEGQESADIGKIVLR
ncbi:Calpain-5, partial [Physocladia obscura]